MSFIDEKEIAAAMSVKLDFDVLPEKATFQEGIRRAPDRGFRLTQAQTEIALKNALRYIPKKFHQELIPEFLEELKTRGRIYGYRFRPKIASMENQLMSTKENAQLLRLCRS